MPRTERDLAKVARVHDACKAGLPKDLDSLCAFMAAAVIDLLLLGTTVHIVGQQLDAIVDTVAAEVASRNATSEAVRGTPAHSSGSQHPSL
jgi:hypothetical protein